LQEGFKVRREARDVRRRELEEVMHAGAHAGWVDRVEGRTQLAAKRVQSALLLLRGGHWRVVSRTRQRLHGRCCVVLEVVDVGKAKEAITQTH
jgi:hypothetical protein